MGGVRRHNQELLPRAARLLAEGGGALAVLRGSEPPAFELPPPVRELASRVPAHQVALRALAEGRALRSALREAARRGRPFDLVHTAHLPAPRRLGMPLAFTLHDPRRVDLAPSAWRRRTAALAIERAFARSACVIAVSETMARRYRADFGASRVFVVPNAADHLPLLPRAPARAPFLLHVGHLEPRKNLGLLLEALATDRALPRLVLAGAAKDAMDERLRTRAAELGVAPRLELRGPVSDGELARLYAATACVVLPSRLEGFGIPALEARRAGAPLAVAAAGALPEVAGPGAASFPPDDASACARAIRAALATPEERLGESSRAAREASWDRSASRLVEAWRQATALTG